MTNQDLWKSIPYTEWMQEADKVFQEELQQYGSAPSPDSIMRRAHLYVLKTVPNEHGGIGSILVQDGWQQAMRRKQP